MRWGTTPSRRAPSLLLILGWVKPTTASSTSSRSPVCALIPETNRPETEQFFDLAERMGYLNLPYQGEDWGQAVAETPEQFVQWVSAFSDEGILSLDVGTSMIDEWKRNLEESGASYEEAFIEVCLQAWELR